MAVAHHYLEVRASIDEWVEHLSQGSWVAVCLTPPQDDFPNDNRLYTQGSDRLSHLLFFLLIEFEQETNQRSPQESVYRKRSISGRFAAQK